MEKKEEFSINHAKASLSLYEDTDKLEGKSLVLYNEFITKMIGENMQDISKLVQAICPLFLPSATLINTAFDALHAKLIYKAKVSREISYEEIASHEEIQRLKYLLTLDKLSQKTYNEQTGNDGYYSFMVSNINLRHKMIFSIVIELLAYLSDDKEMTKQLIDMLTNGSIEKKAKEDEKEINEEYNNLADDEADYN